MAHGFDLALANGSRMEPLAAQILCGRRLAEAHVPVISGGRECFGGEWRV